MTDNLIPVEGENYLFRDTKSNAIINTNSSDHNSYISRKKFQEGEKERLGVWGVDNPNTVMGQMTLDYNAYKTKGGRGAIGMAERIKRNADLIQLWGEGRHARLPLMDAFQTP